MEITKREIIVSIAIAVIMITIGVFISTAINNAHLDKVQIYNTAISIDTQEEFEYCLKTNVGNAFVYGHLEVLDPVSYDEIGGSYWYVKKVTEKYRQHTRVVTYTDSKGHSHTRLETYWSWDAVYRDERCCTAVRFLGVEFCQSKFKTPYEYYIDTVSAGTNKRYVFYGVSAEFDGTIFTKLEDNTISNSNELYKNKSIAETKDDLISFDGRIPFWIAWVFLIAGVLFAFYYIDNEWLE